MNKFVKLPLFLGVCGALCAGVLATVSAITTPIVEKRLENEKNANYLELMQIEAADKFEDGEVTDSLKSKYVTAVKVVYVGDEVIGVVYDGFLNDGFSEWNLQLGIKEGTYTGLKYSSPEPDGVGLPMIKGFSEDIIGKTIDTPSSDISASVSSQATNPMLREFVSACAADYSANYK